MSFDLGNWWEKLNLDILQGRSGGGTDGDGDDSPDSDLPDDFLPDDDYHDPSWDEPDPHGHTDPMPEPQDDNPYGDDDGASVPLPGGGSATPSWDDGPRIDFTWPFDWP